MKKILLLLAFGSLLSVHAQIPQSRIMDWTHVGMLIPVPPFTNIENILNHGGIANDTSVDNAIPLQTLLNNVGGTGTVIYFPAGTYTFKTPVNIPSSGKVVIRGDLSNTTIFQFTCDTTHTGDFQIWGGQDLGPLDVLSGAVKNSQQLTLNDVTGLNVGDWIDISQENDSSVMATQNPPNALQVAPRTVGQIMKITAINGNTVDLDRPLHYTYNMTLTVQVNRFVMVEQVGFENFTIQNLHPGDKSNFGWVYVANSWIKCVRSLKSVNCHVNLAMCANCMVRDSYFHESWEYGSGGRGYGVAITTHSTDNLVENNVFDKNRHAMLVQRGANGNVFGYNYSINATADGTISIFNRITDVSLHGHFNYMNLFEGNVIEEIHAGDTWGPCGNGNTFFRNRLTREGIRISDNSIEQNIVGNDLRKDNTAPFTYNDITIDAAINLLVDGNKEAGVVSWDPNLGSNNLIQSYYLGSAPTFFGNAQWPALGPEYPSGTIPAEIRQGLGLFTECEAAVNSIAERHSYNDVRVYPNPATSIVNIELNDEWKSISVYDCLGKCVAHIDATGFSRKIQLDAGTWVSGVYSIVIHRDSGSHCVKFIRL